MKDIERITSKDNQRLLRARRVREGTIADSMFIEGKRLVDEAIGSKVLIQECFVDHGFAASETGRELLDRVSKTTPAIAELPEKIFASIADTKQSQGIILIARRPESSATGIEARLKSSASAARLVVFLKDVNNPSNLGAIIRTAEAAGICGVIVSKNSADAFSPKSLRASMGACFRFPVWDGVSLDLVLDWAKNRNLKVTAADVKADKVYTDVGWKEPRLLLFGSEAHGLDEAELARVSETIRVPIENEVESLNLAVSAAIILFEAKRQNAL